MTRKDLKNAYDSVNPTPEEKARMLEHILARADIKEEPVTRKAPVEYRAKPVNSRKMNWGSLIAACFALIALSGVLAIRLLNDPVSPGAKDPTVSIVTEPPVSADTVPTVATVPTLDESAYEGVLERYRQALTESWTGEVCAENNLSSRTPIANEYDGLYYAISDLNGDGVAELVVTENTWEENRTEFLDLYTLKSGEALLVASDREFLRPMLYEGGVVMTTDPGPGNSHMGNYSGYYRLEGETLVMETAAYQTEDGQWYEWDEKNLTAEKITEERAGEIAATYRIAALDFRALVKQPGEDFRTGDGGYDDILAKYKAALTEDWTGVQCETADISVNIPDALPDLGWCLMDLDFNGTKELIIADSARLYDLYTIMPTDGLPGHILTAWASDTYHLHENGVIQKQEFYAKGCGWFWFTLEGMDLVQQDVVHYTNFEGANQYSYGPDQDHLEPIDKDSAGTLLNRYKAAELELNYFTEVQEKTIADREIYQKVLDIYGKAASEEWNPGQCIQNGISLMIGYSDSLIDTWGVAFLDLDRNGTEELLITDGKFIYDLYTIIDDEEYGPVRLLSATERSTYELMEGNVIFNRGSSSAAVSSFSYYVLEERNLVLLEGYLFDAEEAPENPWFYFDGENRGERCADTSPSDIVNFGYSQMEISFTPMEG